MKLYTYFRSSAAFRVRIALNIKNIEHALVPISLVRDGGEHKQAEYLAKNPQGLVPLLELDSPANEPARYLSQSLAMLEYLDEEYPTPSLMPKTAIERARVRSIAQTIAIDIHPLDNLRVLKYLINDLNVEEEQKNEWHRHWVELGFSAVEKMLANSNQTGDFCHGDSPTIADCCLIPQVYNAERFNCPMDAFPNIQRINSNCLKLEAFVQALPENQADAS